MMDNLKISPKTDADHSSVLHADVYLTLYFDIGFGP